MRTIRNDPLRFDTIGSVTPILQGDLAVLMPTRQPRNGSLVVARLADEGIVFKVFTAREQASVRICSFTSYNPVFQPLEVPESRVLWNFSVYQIVRQIWH